MAYTQIPLSTLRLRLQAKFESVPFFTIVEQDVAINEALQWYNLYTGLWKRRVSATTSANLVYYSTPSTLVYNSRMEFNGKLLNQSSLTDMDNGRAGWEGETTADGGDVPSSPQTWIPVGLLMFALWPADAAGNNGLLIDGVHTTPTLTLPTDTIDIDDSEIDAILGEALYILCFKDPARAPKVGGWHDEFLRTILAQNGRLRAANAFRAAQGSDLARQQRPLVVAQGGGES